MKTNALTLLFVLFILMLSAGDLLAQDTTKNVMHVLVKYDGTEFIGRIISQDAREVMIETKEAGEVITHLAFYAGWPSAFTAVPVAKHVFDKRPR